MKMRWSFWAVIVSAGLVGSGCFTYDAPDVTTHYDQFSGLRTDLLEDNLLDTGSEPRELLWLNASRVFNSSTEYVYYLEVTYMAREGVGYLGISPGESLVLKLDEETLPLRGTGSMNTSKELKDGLVQETSIYKVSKLVLQKISVAQAVEVQVKGRNGLVERKFTPDNFDKFRRFVTRYAL